MATPASADFRFVHLTDTHLMAGGTWRPRAGDFEFDTEASLRRVIAAVRALDPAPAFAVFGGDLASPDLLDRDPARTPEQYEPSYRLLAEIVGQLPCPAHFLVGNHDHRAAFNRVLRTGAPSPDAPHYYSFDHGRYHFVVLDSHEPGQAAGLLDAAQLRWLRADLAEHRRQPTLVFVHHHLWPLGLQWIDSMSLRNGQELVAALGEHPDVRWVICGHVHLDHASQRGRLTMLTTPSTCIQLSKVSQAAKVFPGPPGFRIVDVAGDQLSTRVIHLHGAGVRDV
ncbi:MAG TPA: metallophosphoesterase [Methylomirabilota bacterium]